MLALGLHVGGILSAEPQPGVIKRSILIYFQDLSVKPSFYEEQISIFTKISAIYSILQDFRFTSPWSWQLQPPKQTRSGSPTASNTEWDYWKYALGFFSYPLFALQVIMNFQCFPGTHYSDAQTPGYRQYSLTWLAIAK